jgi:hypothetical protein
MQLTDRMNQGQILGWGVAQTGQKWVLRPMVVGGKSVLRLEVGSGYIYGTTDLADGNWHHLAVVHKDDGSMDVSEAELYVDGLRESIGGVVPMAVATTAGEDMKIGVHTNVFFHGLLDQICLYSRALSSTEIGTLFKETPFWDTKSAWRPSAAVGGSPGSDDSGLVPAPGAIVFNEVLSHSHLVAPDWIELYNTTADPIHIGGWFLSDSNKDDLNKMKYQIAQGTVIDGYGYKVFYQGQHFGNTNDPGCLIPFALSEGGETVYLQSGMDGQLTGYAAAQQFDAAESGVAFGRYIKSSLDGGVNFVAMAQNTPNDLNSAPKVGPIVFTEIMYNPNAANTGDEYIELRNITSSPVTLQDAVSTETSPGVFKTEIVPWRFNDGIEYIFPANTTIPAGGLLIVAKNPTALKAYYGGTIPGNVSVLGPFANSTSLSNGGEKVRLSRPGDQELGQDRYWIRAEQVTYDDEAPWPLEPDGAGTVLNRINATTYGNDVNNWQAANPSPGL